MTASSPPPGPSLARESGPSPVAPGRSRCAVRVLRARFDRPRRRLSLAGQFGAPVGGGDGAAGACDDEARALFRDRASAGAARRGGFRRPRDARAADPASRRPLGRLFLVVRPRRPARARQARLWPRLRAARRLEREMRGPSRRGPAARRYFRSAGDAVLGARPGRQRRGIPRGLDPFQRLSRSEFQHAHDRSADGGVRSDRREDPISTRPSGSPI